MQPCPWPTPCSGLSSSPILQFWMHTPLLLLTSSLLPHIFSAQKGRISGVSVPGPQPLGSLNRVCRPRTQTQPTWGSGLSPTAFRWWHFWCPLPATPCHRSPLPLKAASCASPFQDQTCARIRLPQTAASEREIVSGTICAMAAPFLHVRMTLSPRATGKEGGNWVLSHTHPLSPILGLQTLIYTPIYADTQ